MLQPDVAALFEGASSLTVGSVDASGNPNATRAWGARLQPDGTLRALVAAEALTARENLGTTRVIALCATDVPTLRAVQVKGRVVTVEDAGPDDRDLADRYRSEFFRTCADVEGVPISRLLRLAPGGYFAVVLTIDELYDQTPGPGAGAAIALAR